MQVNNASARLGDGFSFEYLPETDTDQEVCIECTKHVEIRAIDVSDRDFAAMTLSGQRFKAQAGRCCKVCLYLR